MKSKSIFIEYNDGTHEYFYNVTFHGYSDDTLHINCGEEDSGSRHTRSKRLIRKMDVIPEATPPQSYTEADLVSFGEHVLSTERISNIFKNHSDDPFEAIRQVYHADLENWKEGQRSDECGCDDGEACYNCNEPINIVTIAPTLETYTGADMKDFAMYYIESPEPNYDLVFEEWKQENQSDS